MRYRNKKTGAVTETKAVVSGENWEAVKIEPKEPKEKKKSGK